MSNYLENGAVLPSGLLSGAQRAVMSAFNKNYNNAYLRVGVVVNSYLVSDPSNVSRLCTEYDVSVIEQNQDIGATTTIYRNCMVFDGLGSIADFSEKTLRVLDKKTTKGDAINLSGQNGAIVLLLCQDGMSSKGVIIGGFPHPDRATNLTDDGPKFESQFNGTNLLINPDGSATVSMIGATDNDGKPLQENQMNTVFSVETDGSFQLSNPKISLRMDSSGSLTINANSDTNISCNNATITAQGDVDVSAQGNATVDGKVVNLGKNASEAVIKGKTFKQYFDTHTHPTPVGPSGPPTSPMPGSTLSSKVNTE